MTISRCLALSAMLTTAFCTSHAPGQERDPVAADTLFREGIELLKRDDWASACPKFDASMRLDPSVGAAINIARCHERAGKTLTALRGFQRAKQLNRSPSGEVLSAASDQFIADALARIEPRVPKITISAPGAPSDLVIELDGSRVERVQEPIDLDPGNHALVATASGFQKLELVIEVSDAKTTDVRLVLQAVASGSPAAQATRPPPPPPPAVDGGLGAQRIVGLVLAGLGAATLAGSAVTGGLALGASNDLEDLDCQPTADGERLSCAPSAVADARDAKARGEGLAVASTVTLFSGIALAGAALTVYLTAPSSREVSITPLVGPGFAGVAIGGAL